MNKHAEYTQDRLDTIRRVRTRSRVTGIVLNLVALLLLLLLAVALLDYWLLLPVAGRAVGLVLLTGLAGCGLVNLWRWWRRPVSLKQIALELEAHRPELGCLLSTAAEHLDQGKPHARADHYSPELVASLQEHSARRLLQIDADWYRRELLRSVASCAVMVLLVGGFLALAPAGNMAFLRTLIPWQNFAYTTVQVEPGNVEVPVGQNQSITAGFLGRLPKDPQVEWRTPESAGWQTIALFHEEENRFVNALEQIQQDLIYRVRGAQAVSPEFTIATFVPPALNNVAIEVEYPAYTGLAPERLHDPNLSVVRGSRLRWMFETTGDIQQARMRFASLPGVELKPATTNTWTTQFAPKSDLHYWVDLLDRKQRKGGNNHPYQVAVLPDEKPKADVVEPGADIRANPLEVIPVAITVSDDFGLVDARLVVRKMDGTTKAFPLRLTQTGLKEARLETVLDLAPFKLKPYELLSYYVEAKDNNTLDGPGVGKSPVYFIEYTTGEHVLADCRGAGTKINLLQLEKQIIAATMAIPEDQPADKFADIAGTQREVRKYGDIVREAFQLSIAPPKAREEFDSALREMDLSAGQLDGLNRDQALCHQEAALQHLYEVCRLLPECEAGMCRGQGNCVKIVLEAIEKLKQQEKKDREATLQQALAQARQIQRKQMALNNLYRAELKEVPPGDGGSSVARNATDSKGSQTGTNPGSSNNGQGEQSANEPQEMSAQQRQLAEQAAALAKLLSELAGRDGRVSHRYGQQVAGAATQLRQAGQAVGGQNYVLGQTYGGGGVSIIGEVIFALERIYEESAVSADLAAEEYPKAFEGRINAYLKTLSYAE